MSTGTARPEVDQWLAAVAEVDGLPGAELLNDERTELVVQQLLSGTWRAMARDAGCELPAEMDGRLLVIWTNGEVQQLTPGFQLTDIDRPRRVGTVGGCDRCGRTDSLPAAYVVPSPPSLIGLVVCGDCAIEMAAGYDVPWVVKK
jgi:hypothetical protein